MKAENQTPGTGARDTEALAALGEPRRSILVMLKRRGALGVAEMSRQIDISYEGMRQQLRRLEQDGWVIRALDRGSGGGPGRPRTLFRLSNAGDHLFPKEYEELAVALIDAAADRLGPEAVRTLLEEVATRKIERLAPRVAGKDLDARLEVLRDIYLEGDPFCRVEYGDEQSPSLVEMNCPYLDVAQRRPALCSVTVSVLRRLLGRKVIRTDRFQDGGGRCVFKVVDADDEDAPLFDWEPEAPTAAGVKERSRRDSAV